MRWPVLRGVAVAVIRRCGERLTYPELLALPDGAEVWMKYWEFYDRTPNIQGVFKVNRIQKSNPLTWELEGKNTGGEFTHTGEPEGVCWDNSDGAMTHLFKVKVS